MNSKRWAVEQDDAGMWEVGYWEDGCFNIDDSTPYWTKAAAQKALDEMLERDRRWPFIRHKWLTPVDTTINRRKATF